MTGEFDLFGLLVPELLVYALAALAAQMVIGRILRGLRLYRLVWHPALVEVSVFVLCLGAIVATAHRVHP